MERVVILLISAHLIADFHLQPDWMARKKPRRGILLTHGLIHGLTAYLILQSWRCWSLPLGVALLHSIIDGVKQMTARDTAKTFALDQASHMVGLLGLGWVLTTKEWLPGFSGIGYVPIVVVAGFIATIRGAGYFTGKVVGHIKERNKLQIEGLDNGGALIGNLERALIFLLVYINQPAGIGFLVAAKSILRFQEAKDRKMAEYVLIGTLLSFSLAIAIASATKWAMGR